MIRFAIFFICYFLSFLSFGQITLLGDVDVSDYPNVAFSIHHANPDVLSESIQVRQAIQQDFIPAEVNVVKTVAKVSSENKCVLFLFEYSTHEDKEEQYLTFYSSLVTALPEIVSPGDEIKICSFSLKQNDKFLHEVNDNFTDNSNDLIRSLNKNLKEDPNVWNKHRASALYASIFEGVELLKNHPSVLPKSIVLLSEERNNDLTNLSDSKLSTDLARKNNISINTIKYNRAGTRQYSDATISALSYGVEHELTPSRGDLLENSKKKSEIIQILRDIFRDIPKRAQGSVFDIYATLPDTLIDGREKTIKITSSDDVEVTLIPFMAKGNIIRMLFQKHFFVSLLVSIILFVLLIAVIAIVISKHKKSKMLIEAREKEMDKKREDQRTRVESQQKEIDDLRLQDEERVKGEGKLKVKAAKEAEERKRFIEMQNLGQLPILIMASDKAEQTFTINKSVFWVGRDVSNDLVIQNPNFSKRHFYIMFRDGDYSIYDNKSTNGLKLNGKRISTQTLSNSDVIQIANIEFTFIK